MQISISVFLALKLCPWVISPQSVKNGCSNKAMHSQSSKPYGEEKVFIPAFSEKLLRFIIIGMNHIMCPLMIDLLCEHTLIGLGQSGPT